MSHPHRPFVRRVAPAVTALVIAAAGLALPLAPGAHATSTFAFSRPFDGADRYDTAAKIAVGSGFSNVANVVVATGEQFPDALAGSPLASALDSPVLLTAANSVPNTTGAALVTLKATNVTLLGGTTAISASVENDLKSRGYKVDRVAGIDRSTRRCRQRRRRTRRRRPARSTARPPRSSPPARVSPTRWPPARGRTSTTSRSSSRRAARCRRRPARASPTSASRRSSSSGARPRCPPPSRRR